MLDAVEADPTLEITIDVDRRTIEVPALGISADFPMDDATRERFLEGLDDIGITLRVVDDIDAYESTRSTWLPVTA